LRIADSHIWALTGEVSAEAARPAVTETWVVVCLRRTDTLVRSGGLLRGLPRAALALPTDPRTLVLRIRLLMLLLISLLSGCGLLQPQPEPVPEPVSEPEPAPTPEPPPAPVPTPRPAPPPPPPEPEPEPFKVAVVVSSRAGAYMDVANALVPRLDDVEVYDLSDRSLLPHEAFAAIHNTDARAVVAIGMRAAVLAQKFSALPVLFTQVFNVSESQLIDDKLRGVAAIPPLAAQLDAWLDIAPDLRSVGAIVGAGHEPLLEEAAAAAAARGLEFHHRVAASDRETLYLFTRMVPRINGFWLFPDNRILSASVLREMLAYAGSHGVQVAVFNDSLLDVGAALSATTDPDDIAKTLVRLLQQLQQNGLQSLPRHTPLNALNVRINKRMQERLRLAEANAAGAQQ
jgi:ABC-type uncharacterized transport system substrate-binding protein